MNQVAINHTEPNPVLARAPGKLLLAGEFAVLEGAPALVIAINKYAQAMLASTPPAKYEQPSPLHLAVGEVLEVTSDQLHRLQIDTSALFRDGLKLGLGSSSAACVAAVATLDQGHNSKDRIFELALDAHRRLQSGLGSGFDVAASTYGGALIYVQGEQPSSVNLPAGLFWRAFAWNRPASTRRAIEGWRVVRDHQKLLDATCKLAQSVRSSAADLLDSIDDFQQRLLALDRAHALGIAAPEQHHLAARAQDIAANHGAKVLFKQSGAGGGDVGIALSTSIEALQAFSDIAVQSGLEPLDIDIDFKGVVRE